MNSLDVSLTKKQWVGLSGLSEESAMKRNNQEFGIMVQFFLSHYQCVLEYFSVSSSFHTADFIVSPFQKQISISINTIIVNFVVLCLYQGIEIRPAIDANPRLSSSPSLKSIFLCCSFPFQLLIWISG